MLGILSGLLLKSVPGLGILPAWVWRAAAIVLVILALFATGWIYGSGHVQKQWVEERGQRAIAEVKLRAARVEVVTKIETKYRDVERLVHITKNVIVEGVPNYVTKSDDSACELRNGFLRDYDASLRNESPGPAVSSDREPAGIALSDATKVIAENNALITLARNKLAACIDFYRQQQSLTTRSK